MFCKEDRIPRELFLAGFGFQVWCQLLTHISRSTKSTTLIVDEPEVYLHPDVQRQLIGILRDCGPDIILATHSTEIMGEADASEILLVDKNRRSAERLRDIEGVQTALEAVGSVQNLTLAQLARTKRVMFVEGFNDFKILRRFAHNLGFVEVSSAMDLTVLESGGFSSWERIKSLVWGFTETLKSEIHVGAIFDRDYWCSEELDNIELELKRHLKLAHIHRRKEVENYLLVPDVLERVLEKAIREREKRNGVVLTIHEKISSILDRITIPLKNQVQAQYISKRVDYLKNSPKDNATITIETMNSLITSGTILLQGWK